MPKAPTPQLAGLAGLFHLRHLREQIARHYNLLAEVASVPQIPPDASYSDENWPADDAPIEDFKRLIAVERERIDDLVIEIADRLRSER